MKIYLEQETRLFTQDEIDSLLTVLHGSITNRLRLIVKRVILFYKNLFDYRLIIIRNKFVYVIGLRGYKKELSEDSFYSYLMETEINGW